VDGDLVTELLALAVAVVLLAVGPLEGGSQGYLAHNKQRPPWTLQED
jgi:hypothetical protein